MPDRPGPGARMLLCVPFLLLCSCGEQVGGPPVPPDVTLEVVLEATPQAAQKLAIDPALKPTYSEGAQHAWSLEALFGPAARHEGARLEIHDGDGTMTLVERPFRPDAGRVWVLRRNKKGEAQLVLVDRAVPFPEFHGRGGNRGRSGDETPRVRNVVRLRLVFSKVERPVVSPAEGKARLAAEVRVTLDGKERPFTESDLRALEPFQVEGDSGEGTRDAWPVRALARALGGDAARVTEVQARGGRSLVVHADDWADATKVPLLRLNRRGQLKFHWADETLKPTKEPDLRDVVGLVIVTH